MALKNSRTKLRFLYIILIISVCYYYIEHMRNTYEKQKVVHCFEYTIYALGNSKLTGIMPHYQLELAFSWF